MGSLHVRLQKSHVENELLVHKPCHDQVGEISRVRPLSLSPFVLVRTPYRSVPSWYTLPFFPKKVMKPNFNLRLHRIRNSDVLSTTVLLVPSSLRTGIYDKLNRCQCELSSVSFDPDQQQLDLHSYLHTDERRTVSGAPARPGRQTSVSASAMLWFTRH